MPAQARGFDGNVQAIASAAHARGVALKRADAVIGSVEAAELCRVLRLAHERSRGDTARRGHVEKITAAIAFRVGPRGPVEISRTAWGLLRGYAATTKGAADAASDR